MNATERLAHQVELVARAVLDDYDLSCVITRYGGSDLTFVSFNGESPFGYRCLNSESKSLLRTVNRLWSDITLTCNKPCPPEVLISLPKGKDVSVTIRYPREVSSFLCTFKVRKAESSSNILVCSISIR